MASADMEPLSQLRVIGDFLDSMCSTQRRLNNKVANLQGCHINFGAAVDLIQTQKEELRRVTEVRNRWSGNLPVDIDGVTIWLEHGHEGFSYCPRLWTEITGKILGGLNKSADLLVWYKHSLQGSPELEEILPACLLPCLDGEGEQKA